MGIIFENHFIKMSSDRILMMWASSRRLVSSDVQCVIVRRRYNVDSVLIMQRLCVSVKNGELIVDL